MSKIRKFPQEECKIQIKAWLVPKFEDDSHKTIFSARIYQDNNFFS